MDAEARRTRPNVALQSILSSGGAAGRLRGQRRRQEAILQAPGYFEQASVILRWFNGSGS